jgi:hypothetical protein
MRWRRDTRQVLYAPKGSDDDPEQRGPDGQSIDPLEFVARVITQIPEPKKRITFYDGRYANVCPGRRLQGQGFERMSSLHRSRPTPLSARPARQRSGAGGPISSDGS